MLEEPKFERVGIPQTINPTILLPSPRLQALQEYLMNQQARAEHGGNLEMMQDLKAMPFRQFMQRVRHVENLAFELGLDEAKAMQRGKLLWEMLGPLFHQGPANTSSHNAHPPRLK